ncbi:hypothetical protein GG344DRAFT_82872 [Lentinula edodes]|nr:hypothetical protein GG344DRAFT_82872 [Lentinula edodes]
MTINLQQDTSTVFESSVRQDHVIDLSPVWAYICLLTLQVPMPLLFFLCHFTLALLQPQHIINSYFPPPLDLHKDIPLTFWEFIREIDQLCSQRLPSDLKEFNCAVATNWKRLWPWMRCLLEANRVFEHQGHPSAELINRAFFCVKAVLSVLTQIFSSSTSSSIRLTQSSLVCKIFDSSHFTELLSLAWAVAVIHPQRQDYFDEVVQMLNGTNLQGLVDSHRLEYLARQLEVACSKITGESFDHWIHLASVECAEFNRNSSLINGPQTYLLLQLVNEVPGNSLHRYLKKANTAMTFILGSNLSSPNQIPGGARWVAAVLDHNLIFLVIKIRDFLEGVRDNDGIRHYKPYFSVSHRIKLNLDLCEKRFAWKSLRLALVRIRASLPDIALQNEWQIFQLKFYVKDALALRRASWDCARLSHCSFDQILSLLVFVLAVVLLLTVVLNARTDIMNTNCSADKLLMLLINSSGSVMPCLQPVPDPSPPPPIHLPEYHHAPHSTMHLPEYHHAPHLPKHPSPTCCHALNRHQNPPSTNQKLPYVLPSSINLQDSFPSPKCLTTSPTHARSLTRIQDPLQQLH